MRRTTAAAIVVVVVLACLIVAEARAGKPPAPECWWEGTTLHAVNLPDEWSMTASPVPAGMAFTADTFTATFASAFTVYIWTRGGPYEALFKPGKQLNDYRPVCVAVP